MFDFVINNVFVMFGGRTLQQTTRIHVGTICTPLLSNLILYSNERDFIKEPLKKMLLLIFTHINLSYVVFACAYNFIASIEIDALQLVTLSNQRERYKQF